MQRKWILLARNCEPFNSPKFRAIGTETLCIKLNLLWIHCNLFSHLRSYPQFLSSHLSPCTSPKHIRISELKIKSFCSSNKMSKSSAFLINAWGLVWPQKEDLFQVELVTWLCHLVTHLIVLILHTFVWLYVNILKLFFIS